MPENDKGQSATESRVGERKFFIHEDAWDGTPTIRQGLKAKCGNLFGLWQQGVFPEPDMLNTRFVPLYDDPDQARQYFIEHAQWQLKHQYKNPNRPGDRIGIESVQRNVNHILRTKWPAAIQQAMDWLDERLASIGMDNPPIQEHQIGDRVIVADGTEATIAEATLWNGSFDEAAGKNGSPYIEYRDERGVQIDVVRAA